VGINLILPKVPSVINQVHEENNFPLGIICIQPQEPRHCLPKGAEVPWILAEEIMNIPWECRNKTQVPMVLIPTDSNLNIVLLARADLIRPVHPLHKITMDTDANSLAYPCFASCIVLLCAYNLSDKLMTPYSWYLALLSTTVFSLHIPSCSGDDSMAILRPPDRLIRAEFAPSIAVELTTAHNPPD